MKPIVALKGQRDGIAVDIDDKADFVSIIECLRQKVSDGKRFFEGANTRVYFRGRNLTPEEENTLLGIITNVVGISPEEKPPESDIGIGLASPAKNAVEATVKASPELSEDVKSAETETVHDKVKKNYTESNCAFYRSGLRSGQSIKYSGSVVVMGDVNPGSEVVADGNVVVLGSLKGLAHAGAAGDESCFVLANIMQPVQLRIASVISSMPAKKQKKQEIKPSYAYVKDGKVCIAGV